MALAEEYYPERRVYKCRSSERVGAKFFLREVAYEEWLTWRALGAECYASVNDIGGAIPAKERGAPGDIEYAPPTWNSWFVRVENPDG